MQIISCNTYVKTTRVTFTILTIALSLIFAATASGAPMYSGTCQDAGFNDQGQNIQVNCGSGKLFGLNCTFITKSMGVLHVICGGSQYIYTCGASSNGSWYKAGQNTYKCII